MKKKIKYQVYLIKDNRFPEVTYHESLIGTYKTHTVLASGNNIPFKISYWDRQNMRVIKQKVLLKISSVKIIENQKVLITITDKGG